MDKNNALDLVIHLGLVNPNGQTKKKMKYHKCYFSLYQNYGHG